jgi:hypothetical protein
VDSAAHGNSIYSQISQNLRKNLRIRKVRICCLFLFKISVLIPVSQKKIGKEFLVQSWRFKEELGSSTSLASSYCVIMWCAFVCIKNKSWQSVSSCIIIVYVFSTFSKNMFPLDYAIDVSIFKRNSTTLIHSR